MLIEKLQSMNTPFWHWAREGLV